ncbi:MAG TPA: SDR family oxidoreductase [Vicinamibacterales bacterium]|nr:SDR family oxidoreductase [Vicinamibacterales bacterium]
MRALVTGATGLLGSHIAAALQPTDDVIGVDRHPWWGDRTLSLERVDLTEGAAMERILARVRPDVLFHCAALVNVDACERSPEHAFAVNAEMPGRLARAAGPDCLVVFMATDGVFRGDAAFSTEETPPHPRTVYGTTKLQGEREVAAASPNHLILRTNFFGWSSGRKQTSAEWLYRGLEAQQPITLFDDFHFTPIYVVDVVSAMLRLIDAGARGLLHLTGGERVSKYEFGMEMARQAGFATANVRRGSIDDAHLTASRPKDMSLSTARAAAILGAPLPGFRDGIARFLADRERSLSARTATAARGSLRA